MECILWVVIFLILIGWNVLILMCKVIKVCLIFFCFSLYSNLLVKCKLVVGVVIVFVILLYIVWYCLVKVCEFVI